MPIYDTTGVMPQGGQGIMAGGGPVDAPLDFSTPHSRAARTMDDYDLNKKRKGGKGRGSLSLNSGNQPAASASTRYNRKGERKSNFKTDKQTGEMFDVKGIKDAQNKNPTTAAAAEILRTGADARALDPGLARQESEGLGGKDMTFRPEDVSMAGVGDIDIERTKAGNFRQTVTEDERTGEFRSQLQDDASGAFDTAEELRGGVAGTGADASGAARGIFGDMKSFDPMQVAQDRFDKLDSILQPARERERSGLESRLFNQGRLESTSGSRELGDYNAAIERERAGMADRQFTEAQGAQTNLLNTAGNLTGVGAGVQGGIFGQGMSGVGGAQQLSEPMMRLMGLANDQGIASSNSKIGMMTAQQAEKESEGGGFMDGPWGKLIGAGITGAATFFGGPVGGIAAQGVLGAASSATSGGGGGGQGVGSMFGASTVK